MSASDIGLLVAPPLVGAAIGLFTNWLAIKMLFRPLVEKRLLGIKVPFTPGILPRERGRLARSLGQTVSVDILDPESIGARLRSEGFKAALSRAVAQLGKRTLEIKPAELASVAEPGSLRIAQRTALKAAAGITASAAFKDAISSAAGTAISEARDVRIADILGREAAAGLTKALADPRGNLATALAETLVKAMESVKDRSLSSLIGEARFEALLVKAVDAAYESVPSAAAAMMADPALRSALEKTGAKIMRRAIDRMSAVQRFFIGLGQYDKAIMESMPSTIDDVRDALGSTLRNEEVSRSVKAAVVKAAMAAAAKPLSSLAFLSDMDARSKAERSIADALAEWARSAGAAEILSKALSADARLGDLLDALGAASERIGQSLAAWIGGVAGGSETGALGRLAGVFAVEFARVFSEAAGRSSIGATTGLGADDIETLADPVAVGLSSLAAAEAGRMLETLDVRSIVVDKIDSLDMIEVERMLLRIMDKELGAITAFGGVLGGIIGLAQSFFLILR